MQLVFAARSSIWRSRCWVAMEHKTPTPSTVKGLYGSSRFCAFPGCSEPHFVVDPNTNKKIANTEVCHICARREGGPRWDRDQTEEENRSDGNLILLCRKHHAFVDDPANVDHYTPEMLRAWKTEQEKQGSTTLTAEEVDAIKRGSVTIFANEINLGGQGGMAPGAGGGGGGAVGSNSRGGAGGHGGRFFQNGELTDPSELRPWGEFVGGFRDERAPGSGGGGTGASGDNSQGGRGGDGGDIHDQSLYLPAGKYRAVVGLAGRLPGEIGGATFMERINEDGSVTAVGAKAVGGLSGDSYLPEHIPELDATTIERGFRVNCLAPCDDAKLEDGVFSVKRIGWSSLDVSQFPVDVVIKVIAIVTKPPEDRCGFYVSLLFNEAERARVALPMKESESGHSSVSCVFRIGAQLESDGECRLVAHCKGILLCETVIEIKRIRRA